jgi:hypothetical protein
MFQPSAVVYAMTEKSLDPGWIEATIRHGVLMQQGRNGYRGIHE